MKKAFLSFFMVFVMNMTADAFAASEPIGAKARVVNEEIVVGDKVRYEISIKLPKAYEIELLEWDENNFTGMAVKDFGRDKKNGFFSSSYKWWFILDSYVSGEYEIAAFGLRYRSDPAGEWQSLGVDSRFITIESLLRESDMDIKDIYGPQKIEMSKKLLMLLISLLVLLLLLGGGFWFFKKGKEVVEIVISPQEEALLALNNLNLDGLENSEELKEFFYQLSFIVRRYIERQFSVKAPEMTTEEFLQYIREGSFLHNEAKEQLSSFFVLADMVKFAKYISSETEASKSFVSVKSFIEQSVVVEQEEDDL